jgi:6-pyruvoyltetrahydropterin/6-carboxytetrahydropterin synthase
MYTLSLKRDFIARHFLIGGDWGTENLPHAHHYVLELRLSGASLDEHGYLVDLVAVEVHLGELIARYRDAMLNDLAEFEGLNPSLEHFARILATSLSERVRARNMNSIGVLLWENEDAWASYTLTL